MAAALAPAAVPAAAPAAVPAPAPVAAAPAATIDSPLVGTFYASPSPDAPAFVKEGSKVTPDTTICIIEAMKVMNEIKAEKSGVIRKVLAVNGKPVQFGQPLFEIDPA
jgi:acetyl-CoA carboxylase biotin carboxyl carrier protein